MDEVEYLVAKLLGDDAGVANVYVAEQRMVAVTKDIFPL